MPDQRTDRQRRADEALDDAVREVVAAYDDAPPTASWDGTQGGVVTHWITLVNSVGHDEDGGFSTTSILHPFGGSSTPWTEVFGLLHRAQLRLDRDYLTPD